MGVRVKVRELSEQERVRLSQGLRSSVGFEARRSQIIVSSARGDSATSIAQAIGYSHEAVRLIIHRFNAHGCSILKQGSRRPHKSRVAFETGQFEKLRALLQGSPRVYGKATSLWSLSLAAEVSFEQGLVARKVSREAVRSALKRLDITWRRAKHWINSPDPCYERKKTDGTG